MDGNIMDMVQQGVASGSVVTLDNLHYTYDATSSQLEAVNDDVTTDYGQGDFQDTYTDPYDYSYDRNGNLTVDNNKGIDETTYTHFNKPSVIHFRNGRSIEYSYDAAGNKVQELILSDDPEHTDYISNFVFTNDSVRYALTPSGRTTFTMTDNGMKNKEEFFVKDHLGNIRSVTDLYTYPVEEYLASYEIASANLENMFFERIDEVRDDKPGSTWIEDLKSARLNGGDPSRRVGTSLLVHVMAGDLVEMNVNNFYDAYDAAHDMPQSESTMLGNIVSTLYGGAGGHVGSEAHDVRLMQDLFTNANFGDFNDLVQGTTDTTKPRAYLNYLLFDESKQLVASMSGSFQANGNNTWTAIGTTQPLVVPQNGYLAVYLSNSTHVTNCLNCGDVFFDQLVFRLSRGNLKEENHYYPFGLPITSLSGADPGMQENRRKYQGNEYIKDQGLNWMDFHARQYDPQIGRFLGVDPLADAYVQEMFNPYAAMGNAPESMIDPNGTFSRVGAWWRNIAWGGDGISKNNKTGEWGVEYNYLAPSGEAISAFVTDGEKPMTQEEAIKQILSDINAINEGRLNGTISQQENGSLVRTLDNQPLDAPLSGEDRIKSFFNMIEPAMLVNQAPQSISEIISVRKAITTAEKARTFSRIGGRKNGEWAKLFEWGTNPIGALEKLNNFSVKDVQRLKDAGVTLKDVKQWRDTYSAAIEKSAGKINETAIYRRELMEAIINLW